MRVWLSMLVAVATLCTVWTSGAKVAVNPAATNQPERASAETEEPTLAQSSDDLLPFSSVPEDEEASIGKAVYQGMREACEEQGFTLEPEAPARRDETAPPMMFMTYPLLEGAEWSDIFLNDQHIGYDICVHDDTGAFEHRKELYALMISYLFEMDITQARDAVEELFTNAERSIIAGEVSEVGTMDLGDWRIMYSAGGIHNALIIADKSHFQ